MARFIYTEVSYTPQSKKWQERQGGLSGTTDGTFWLSEICEAMNHDGEWEFVDVILDDHHSAWRLLFKKGR